MVVNIIYTLILFIFSFLIYLIIKSTIRGFDGKKNKRKKNNFRLNTFKQY